MIVTTSTIVMIIPTKMMLTIIVVAEGSNEDDDHGCGGEWQVAARGSSNDSGGPSDLKVSLTATY